MRRHRSQVCVLLLTLAVAAPAARHHEPQSGSGATARSQQAAGARARSPSCKVPTWTTGKLVERRAADRRRAQRACRSFRSPSRLSGGANQFEKPDKLGVAAFTTAMLREGTKTRDADALALALQLLGTNVGAGVGDESGSLSFLSTTEKFAPTLEHPGRHAVEPDVPGRGARAAARPAARRARPAERAARLHRRPRLLARALRRGPSVRPDRRRNDDQGGHARRRRRVPQGLLPARPRHRHRRRRHRHGDGKGRGGKGARRLARRR